MSSPMAVHTQTFDARSDGWSVGNDQPLGTVEYGYTTADTHGVIVLFDVSEVSISEASTTGFGCFRASVNATNGDVIFGEQVGPTFLRSLAAGAISDNLLLMFVDPDPPAGGLYVLATTEADTTGEGALNGIVGSLFTF